MTQLSELQSALRAGKLKLSTYLAEVCDLIEKTDGHLHVFVAGGFDRSRIEADAERLEEHFPIPEIRPPLYGLPLGVKDIYNVDGFPTACGSKVPSDLFTGPEASAVTRLRSAGVLIMGKTVTTEFACYMPGPTRNPRNPDHTPGGSSSGSAAGVATGFFPVALGTQTVGSVIRPAGFCGVVGFKPSFGRIPTDGIVPVSTSEDHVGYYSADVTGLSLVAPYLIDDWRGAMDPGSVSRGELRIGIPEGPYLERATQEGRAQFASSVQRLAKAGLVAVPCQALAGIEAMYECHMKVFCAEMAHAHRAWYRDHSLDYGSGTAELIERGLSIDDRELEVQLAQMAGNREMMKRLMEARGIDYWLAPSATGPAPKGLESTGDPIMNLPWTHLGMPVVSIPSGMNPDGLPFGLQLVARPGRDEELVGFAEVVAKALSCERQV
jgi:Asp-tRNA(Asn)/Glu-tRNA(Gln) amidotransferase A subunit family amidase